ncbi:MAG: zinc-ribbon domain-containing protein [Candidatus Acidiferrales bacterium]
MAHCTKCGAVVADNASFCAACGAPNAAAGASPAPSAAPANSPGAPAQTQMAENVAGTLCYALGWITGLIFYFIDKRPYVRFHAAQSIVVFGGLGILSFALNMFFGFSFMMGGWTGFSLGYALDRLLWLLIFILWILLMIKAHHGERFRVPIAADIAESIFGKS